MGVSAGGPAGGGGLQDRARLPPHKGVRRVARFVCRSNTKDAFRTRTRSPTKGRGGRSILELTRSKQRPPSPGGAGGGQRHVRLAVNPGAFPLQDPHLAPHGPWTAGLTVPSPPVSCAVGQAPDGTAVGCPETGGRK